MDKKKLPSFFRDFPEERLKELVEDESPKDFDKVMDKLLHTDKKDRQELNSAFPTISSQ